MPRVPSLPSDGRDRWTGKITESTNEGALVAELKAVRRQGYALSEGEYVSELYCVAAPNRNAIPEVVAAIGIGATAADFEMNREKMVREVMRAAQVHVLPQEVERDRPSHYYLLDRALTALDLSFCKAVMRRVLNASLLVGLRSCQRDAFEWPTTYGPLFAVSA